MCEHRHISTNYLQKQQLFLFVTKMEQVGTKVVNVRIYYGLINLSCLFSIL